MRASQFFISTLKEVPAEAEIISHQLMVRAGLINRVGSGIYNYMPMGLRSIRKIETIVREEMNHACAIEMLMPLVQPAELWQETGRWEKMGPELLRFQDRHGRDFAFQPTSEEVVTDVVRSEIRSYKQLPINFYHIQTKFRDERRPRFGLMRGREFTMKDAYSFDRDIEGMEKSYQTMFSAYNRIFTRLGLKFRAVTADNGAIGGSGSQEFHVIAQTGEDLLVYCPNSDYAANLEAATALPILTKRCLGTESLEKIATPRITSCKEVAKLLNIPLTQTVKAIVLATDNDLGTKLWLLLLRGDHEMNEIKARKLPGLANARFANEAEILAHFGTKPGYLGPISPKLPLTVIADSSVALMSNFVCGANENQYHLKGVNWGRDLPEPDVVADIRNVVEGDLSPDGMGTLRIERGIEVGHVFQLGTRYSEDMKATFLNEAGKPQSFQMGCYGIGITRILSAAIEQNFDERGIIWPNAIAPFVLVLCPIAYERSTIVKEAANTLYTKLLATGVDVILDDRFERPGVMLSDWELIGIPHRIVIGERGLKDGMVEYQGRREVSSTTIPAENVLSFIQDKLKH